MEKDLRHKAVKIQGKQYILVADRIIYFNEHFPQGAIKTELITDPTEEKIVIKATVTPDINRPERFFTGYSQTIVGQGFINRTAALENAETSAVGRALAMMGIGVIESVASVDEINKTKIIEQFKERVQTNLSKTVQPTRAKDYGVKKVSDLSGTTNLNVNNAPF